MRGLDRIRSKQNRQGRVGGFFPRCSRVSLDRSAGVFENDHMNMANPNSGTWDH